MVVFMFLAFAKDGQGRHFPALTDSVVPGETNLFEDLRDIGQRANLGRYRRLDLDIDSPTHGLHLFEKGWVQIFNAHIKKRTT